MAETRIDINFLDRTIEVDVTYFITGAYRPQTMVDPAEYPELEINSVWVAMGGNAVDLNSILTDDDFSTIEDLVMEQLKAEGDDF
jgi:hypothetical protein